MLSAQEAYRIGLVNEIVPRDQLIPRAEAICGRSRQRAAGGQVARSTLLTTVSKLPRIGLALSSLFGICAATEDKTEGTAAFLAKRAPNFQGR